MNRSAFRIFALFFLLMLLTGCSLFKPRSALVQEQNETVIANIQTDYPQLFLQPTENTSAGSLEKTILPIQTYTPLPQNTAALSGAEQTTPEIAVAEPSVTLELTKTTLMAVAKDREVEPTLTMAVTKTDRLTVTGTAVKLTLDVTEISPITPENTAQPKGTATAGGTKTAEGSLPAATETRAQAEMASLLTMEPETTDVPQPTRTEKALPLVAITPLIATPTVAATPLPKKDGPALVLFEAPAYAAALSGTLTAGHPDVYTFLADEGQYLRLKLTASEEDVKLELSHAEGDLSLPDNLQSENLVIRIPKKGWYSLTVRRDDGVGQGKPSEYSLQLALPDKLTLTKNVPVLHLQDELQADGSWRFTAQVEQDFLLQLKLAVPPETEYQLHLIDLEEGEIIEISDSRSIDWLSEKGSGRTYLVELLNGNQPALFDLTLEQMREIGL